MCVKLEQKFKFQQCAQSAQSRHMCCSRSTQSIPGHKKYIIDIDDRNSFLQSLQKTRKNRRLNQSLGEKIVIKRKIYMHYILFAETKARDVNFFQSFANIYEKLADLLEFTNFIKGGSLLVSNNFTKIRHQIICFIDLKNINRNRKPYTIQVLICFVEFWELSHSTRDLSQAEEK